MAALERLLIEARLADRRLWPFWMGAFPKAGATCAYVEPTGLFVLQGLPLEPLSLFEQHEEAALELFAAGALPLPCSGFLMSFLDKHYWLKAKWSGDSYFVFAAQRQIDGWVPFPMVVIIPKDEKHFAGVLDRRYAGKVNDDEHVGNIVLMLRTGIAAAAFSRRQTNVLSACRRPAAARQGWRGYRYEICDLNQIVHIQPQPGGGTHASPIGHWVRGHLRRLRNGEWRWFEPRPRGDFSRGEVIKDWVRDLGLAT